MEKVHTAKEQVLKDAIKAETLRHTEMTGEYILNNVERLMQTLGWIVDYTDNPNHILFVEGEKVRQIRTASFNVVEETVEIIQNGAFVFDKQTLLHVTVDVIDHEGMHDVPLDVKVKLVPSVVDSVIDVISTMQ